jgi:hypothetical protein
MCRDPTERTGANLKLWRYKVAGASPKSSEDGGVPGARGFGARHDLTSMGVPSKTHRYHIEYDPKFAKPDPTALTQKRERRLDSSVFVNSDLVGSLDRASSISETCTRGT